MQEQFGGTLWTGLLLNALIFFTLVDYSLKLFWFIEIFPVNERGSYAAVQEVLPVMMKQNSGSIILVAPPIYSRSE